MWKWLRLLLLIVLPIEGKALGQAAIVWDGPTITFTKSASGNGTQPADQDRLTGQVWLTRATLYGLFNAKTETSYTHYSSPAGTEWAYGGLANYSSLSYTNWEGWNGHQPPSMVGRDAVVHLIAENIYLSIRFISWDIGTGGFSYQRSTPRPRPALTLSKSGNNYVLTYTGTLQSAITVNGTYADVTGASSPYTIPTGAASMRFYRASN